MGSMDVSVEDACLIGRLLFIDDIITYEGETVPELIANFKAAVDRYLAHCTHTGKPANKPYSGTFNVRIGPELHRAAVVTANSASLNLNEFVADAIKAAIDKDLAPTVMHNHNHHHLVTIQQDEGNQSTWTPMTSSNQLEIRSATTIQ